ncbi:CDP-glycerol glycerophosphotransferase, TagB/SpsB family [Clostridium cavendishii DSM 21758]|uniref:CDP-glycerol glycerophosphotransferase, TagB/SpsB family n=1 Tax=Clostridium cavendishii DSM 21758 TaxID=1121302 RepID=A0A1M6AZQ7_9CLOT|nr:CDP-glycerol glycerophosphotransferase family protein [Clostridium cavendishii]SHI41994.1 CDP-glycerol glycerophosphotransferase, TagB/SpsB family [Clostridium cavendishii DSM 21758]
MKKYKIMIFGTGKAFKEIMQSLDFNKVEILGLVDNDSKKQNKKINNYNVYSPLEIKKLNFDYILIASQFSYEIYSQLRNMDISHDRIIPILHGGFTQKLNIKYKEFMNNITITKQRKIPRIALCKENNSGSSSFALYKKIPNYIKEKYEVDLVTGEEIEVDMDYDLVCCTHLSRIKNPRVINVELWHGFPLKKIGIRTDQFDYIKHENFKSNVDVIISYSELYSNIFNAAYPNEYYKYEICGMPRNDLLFNKNEELMVKLFGKEISNKKVIFYLPTYRKNKHSNNDNLEGDRKWSNIFGFEDFNLELFVTFLRKNNLMFLCKLHPIEKNKLDKESFRAYSDVILLIEEEMLEKNEIDLYEILANVDLLITDYSSVYFDVLLIDMPIMFIPTDIDYYKENRGFNFEPYEFWTPGPKVYTEKELINSILKILDNDEYKEKRSEICSIIHTYNDDKACERVWSKVGQLLERNNMR